MSTLDEILNDLQEDEGPELSFDERVKLAIEDSKRRIGENPDLTDVMFETVRSKSDAFDFVVELLVTHKPDLFDQEGEKITGGELVLAEIRRLQALETQMGDTAPEGNRAH